MEVPHVVLLPFPAQGHIKPMFMLGKLLSHAGFDVTLVNTEHNQSRFLNQIDQTSFYNYFPGFQFKSIADGLPTQHPRSAPQVLDLFESVTSMCMPHFRDLLLSLCQDKEKRSPTCIIADGVMSFAIDVGEELGLPVITFRTYNATATWVYFHLHNLIQNGDIPLPLGDEDLDRPITCIPELESMLRRRDLPSFCKLPAEHPIMQFYLGQTCKMTRASALILNTFEELEAPIISQLHSIFPKIYTIGPLHNLFQSRMKDSSRSDGSLRKQDQDYIRWLDSHPPRSVIYVSFGSVVVLTRDQLIEFWYGLVNSGKPFLWVIRPDLVWEGNGVGETEPPADLAVGTKERGCIVSWTPQEEVLVHKAVGGFLTHSGWNSTLESICAGVPMICWPLIADQHINSRCVGEMWKTGFDMKDTCDRSTVEKMVRVLMEDNKQEIMKSAVKNALMAHDSIKEGGSSYGNMVKLIEDIRQISAHKHAIESHK